MIERSIRTRLWELYLDNPTLAKYEVPINALLQSFNDDESHEIIFHFLSNLTIISSDQLTFALRLMADQIVKYSNALPTAVVATAMGSDPDSSQAVAQSIKKFLYGHQHISIFNSVSQFQKRFGEFSKCILIDEFSGTGQSIIGRFNHISASSRDKKHAIDISVFLLYAMEKARDSIAAYGIHVHCIKTLKAGLSGHFEDSSLAAKISTVLAMERMLAEEIGGKPLPSLGYGKAEALYSIENWNAPNSNFPILWWPLDVSRNNRTTILTRGEP